MDIMIIPKLLQRSKRLGWIDGYACMDLTPEIVEQSEVQDASADLLKKCGYAELSYSKNYLCHDQISYYAVICLFDMTYKLVGLSLSGMLLNKKGEVVIKWETGTIGEQLIFLGAESAHIIECRSFDPAQSMLSMEKKVKSWSIYIVNQDLIKKYRRCRLHK